MARDDPHLGPRRSQDGKTWLPIGPKLVQDASNPYTITQRLRSVSPSSFSSSSSTSAAKWSQNCFPEVPERRAARSLGFSWSLVFKGFGHACLRPAKIAPEGPSMVQEAFKRLSRRPNRPPAQLNDSQTRPRRKIAQRHPTRPQDGPERLRGGP